MSLMREIENDQREARMIEIYNSCAPFISRIIESYRIEWPVNHDIFQEVFKKLMEHMYVIMTIEKEQIRGYIWCTTRSICCNYLKKEHRVKIESLDELMQRNNFDLPDDDVPPIYENVENEEMSLKVREMIGKLSEREQNILYYKYFIRISDEEISISMGIAASSVRVYLLRARRHLLNLYQECEAYDR